MAALPQQGAAPLAPLTRLSLHTHKNSIPAFGVCTIFAGFHFIREVIPIAIYHCNISIVSRGKGKSAVAAAAYRSGEKLTNEWDGMTHDYTRKGGVVHTEIMLPPHAPPSFSDRSTLWNSVELYEKAGNAQLAREIDAALPIELSREEQIRLVREYCSSQFVSRGMCVDYAIHDTGKGNPHCHIMLTMRPLDERGAWAAKSQKEYDLDENGERIRLPSGRYKTHKIDLTGWNDKDNTLLWRKAWADYTNDFLERNGSPERIDHRSNAERGIDEIPTVHMGVAACQMEKKGIATEKGALNRSIQKTNRLIREIRAQIGKLKEWIADLFKAWETAPKQPQQSPGLANLLMKYLSVQREKSRKYSQRWQQQHTADELKTIAAFNPGGNENRRAAHERAAKTHGVRQKLSNLQAHTGRVSANPLERKTGEVCGSPPRRAYPMGRGKPLSPCPFAGGRENPADLRVGERIYRPQSTAGSGI